MLLLPMLHIIFIGESPILGAAKPVISLFAVELTFIIVLSTKPTGE